MITVVIPTMWKFNPFTGFLWQLLQHPLVHQTILINNCTESTPDHPSLCHPKIKVLDFGCNIFVNPSWNVGVSLSETEIVCIANDDLVFDTRVFSRVLSRFKQNMGCIGLDGKNPVCGDICFEPHKDQNCFGFGQLMFVHQKNWVDIPPELLVYFGDNWIFDVNKHHWGSNFFIKNLLYYTPHAQTSKDHISRLDEERLAYLSLLRDRGIGAWHD